MCDDVDRNLWQRKPDIGKRSWKQLTNRLVLSVILALGLLIPAGCTVTIRGKERPLVQTAQPKTGLEFTMERQEDKRGLPPDRRKSDSTVFQERVLFETEGNVYHPNLMTFTAAAALGLMQENSTLDGDTESSEGELNEYSFQANLLRLKPYPTRINLSRTRDLIARQFQSPLRTTTNIAGANTTLRLEDWPMSFTYTKTQTEQRSTSGRQDDDFDRDVEHFGYTLRHNFSEHSTLSLQADVDDIHQVRPGSTLDFRQQRYVLGHDLDFGPEAEHALDSSFTFYKQTGSFDTETLSWVERLRLRHSKDFDTFYEGRLLQDTFNGSKDTNTRGEIGFEHRLYESLVTTGRTFVSKSDFQDRGDLTQTGGSLDLNYRKTNPWGVLRSVYQVSLIHEKESSVGGTAVVVDEPHTVDTPNPIFLNQSNVDAGSIVISDVSGLDIYTEGDDYFVSTVGNRTRIDFTTFGAISPNLTDGQTVLIDYTFSTTGDRNEDILRQLFRIEQEFDKKLTIFYEHERKDSELDSPLPDEPREEYATDRVGANWHDQRLTALTDYSRTSSTLIPSERTRLEAHYAWTVDRDTSLLMRVSQQWFTFDEQPTTRDIDLFEAGGDLIVRFSPKVKLTSGVEWRDEDDNLAGQTRGFQWRSQLDISYRKLDVTAGVDTNRLDRRNDEVDSLFFFVNVTKRF